MKILHTSDWHLGKRLNQFSRLPEQREVLEELIELAGTEEPDLILISGDLFDAFNPPNEAVELLYSSIKKLTRNGSCPVVALAGNHDSPERIEAPDPLARECGIFFLGYPDSLPSSISLDTGLTADFKAPGLLVLTLPGVKYPVRLLYTPYASESRLRRYLGENEREETLRMILQEKWAALAAEYLDEEGVNLFAGHFFAGRRDDLFQDAEEEEGERPILYPGGLEMIYTDNLPDGVQYAALGHLHRYQLVEEKPVPVCYSGSLLAYSLSEAGQSKGIVMVEAEPKKPVSSRYIPLKKGKKIYRKTFNDPADLKAWLSEHPDCYIEASLKTDDYINGSFKQELLELHDGILALIPLIERETEGEEPGRRVDLGKTVEELFCDYFSERNDGTAPGEELIALFREVRAAGGES